MIDETFEEIKLSGDMPSPAGVGMRILQLTRTDDYETSEIGQAIMTDSSLTGQILRVANSAANASVEPTTTVTEALMRLGSTCVRDLALAFSLVSDRSVGSCVGFDYEGYWSRSLARAVAAQRLSEASGVGKPEEAYICGLLGEIGQLALASVFPDQYSTLIESGVMGNCNTRLEAETQAFKITSAEVALSMLREWGLPDAFSEAIGALATSGDIGEREAKLDSLGVLLRYADLVARAMCIPERLPVQTWEALESGLEMLAELPLVTKSGSLDTFFNGCAVDWVNWGNSLNVTTDKRIRLSVVQERIEEGKQLGLTKTEPTSATPKKGAHKAKNEIGEPTLSILVVEDAADLANIVRGQKVFEGCSIHTATLADALSVALANDPDLVLCRDPAGQEGLELCKLLRNSKLGKALYFMLTSEQDAEDFVVSAFESGIDDLFPHGASERLLMARIQGGVRMTQLQRQVEEDKRTVRKQVSELGILARRLRSAALTDPLTELPNRRYAMKRLETEWSTTSRTGRPLSVMMVDIDKFKAVNDTYGHDAGDLVLKEISAVLRNGLRQADEVCRIGGEEFLVICKHTSQDEAVMVAERLRSAVEACVVQGDGFTLNLTISMGLAERSPAFEDFSALLKAADEQVYVAKGTGRNRVCVAQAPAAKSKRSA